MKLPLEHLRLSVSLFGHLKRIPPSGIRIKEGAYSCQRAVGSGLWHPDPDLSSAARCDEH